jgi:hypothetical protein
MDAQTRQRPEEPRGLAEGEDEDPAIRTNQVIALVVATVWVTVAEGPPLLETVWPVKT